ncbi:hypothetical protein ACFLTH_02995 [Bacteroidota bacterium]
MGQQQLLLVVLGLIIVALAVFVGINLFTAHSIEAKRNNVINDCMNLASDAQRFYRRPVSLGGGGRTFTGWSVPDPLVVTANGTYTAVVNSDNIVLTGVGNEVITGGDSLEIKMTVYAESFETEIIN